MERIDQIYNSYLDKYTQITNFNDQYNYKNIIETLHEHCNTKNIYTYDILYSNKGFEEKCCQLMDKTSNDFNTILNDNKEKIINFFKPFNQIPQKEKKEDKSYTKDFYDIITHFLITINPQLVFLFNDLIDKNNLLYIPNYQNGQEMYDKSSNTIYILIGNNKNIHNMITLVHELGHAYYDILYREYPDMKDINKILKKEIPSQALELRFIKYLLDNNIYKEEVQNYLIYFNNRLKEESTNVIKEIDLNPSERKNIRSSFIYSFGKIIAYHSIINNISYDKLIDYTYEKNIDELIDEINNNEIIINNELNIKHH